MNDEIDRRLGDASERLRADQPDSVAAHQTFSRLHDGAAHTETPRRHWWPALAGVGLVGAAIVGVLAYGALDNDENVLQPAGTAPTVADTDVTVADGSTVPDADIAVTTVPIEAPLTAPSEAEDIEPPEPTEEDYAQFVCPIDGTPAEGNYFATAACRKVGDSSAAVIIELPEIGDDDEPAPWESGRWFVSMGTGVNQELGEAKPVAGLRGAFSLAPTIENGATCTLIVDPGTGNWREYCWLDAPTNQVFTLWDSSLVQFDLTDPNAVVAHVLDDGAAWTSSGCSFDDLVALAAEAGHVGSLFLAVGCQDEMAAIVEGATFLQPGAPDGAIWLFERDGDTLRMIDNGTGIETDLPELVPPHALWSMWNGDTERRASGRDIEAINTSEPFAGAPAPEAVADAALALIQDERDPEFSGPDFPLEIVYVGPELVVIEETLGGDDSVAGVIHFISLTKGFGDGTTYGVSTWTLSTICARGLVDGLCI